MVESEYKAKSPRANLPEALKIQGKIRAFGFFAGDPVENQAHYDKYSTDYDTMQDVTGFNDPRELFISVMEFFPDLDKNTKIIDYGAGTGL
jgi:hypothetical protein